MVYCTTGERQLAGNSGVEWVAVVTGEVLLCVVSRIEEFFSSFFDGKNKP